MGMGDGHDLVSPRFSGEPTLEACFDGEHRMFAGQTGDAVARVQQALIDLGFSLPSGATGTFNGETATAVVVFKTARGLVPNDPVVGRGTMGALDTELVALDAGRVSPPAPVPAPASLRSITFWINAFIPDPATSPQFVLPAPGNSLGLSMVAIPVNVPGLPVPTVRFFLGDNRGFSDDRNASARIHSLVEIVGLDGDPSALRSVINQCGASHELDARGQVISSATAPVDRIRFVKFRGNTTVDPEGGIIVDSPSARFVQIDYEAAANLPLVGGSPDIDMVGVIGIDRDALTLRFRGSVDGFPAFEAYVSVNEGPPIMLFRELPVAPIFLFGGVKRPIDVTVSLPI
ncbi:peptidoglycan-binding protein [Archangium lansingense]|uniref:peptidoglycan-binding protein n=1 Tax=Archangium lansingense TaxID=2995310 RepID=UPI003B76F091